MLLIWQVKVNYTPWSCRRYHTHSGSGEPPGTSCMIQNVLVATWEAKTVATYCSYHKLFIAYQLIQIRCEAGEKENLNASTPKGIIEGRYIVQVD